MTGFDRSIHIDQILFPQKLAVECEGRHEAAFKADYKTLAVDHRARRSTADIAVVLLRSGIFQVLLPTLGPVGQRISHNVTGLFVLTTCRGHKNLVACYHRRRLTVAFDGGFPSHIFALCIPCFGQTWDNQSASVLKAIPCFLGMNQLPGAQRGRKT